MASVTRRRSGAGGRRSRAKRNTPTPVGSLPSISPGPDLRASPAPARLQPVPGQPGLIPLGSRESAPAAVVAGVESTYAAMGATTESLRQVGAAGGKGAEGPVTDCRARAGRLPAHRLLAA